jgi:Zn-finger nucleic acid-binding protein
MAETSCPWCEAELLVGPDVEAEEQTCPECLTSWSYEERTDVALAA